MWCLELSSALLSWGQLPTFNFRGFQCHEVSESSVAMTFVRSGTSSFRGHNRFPPVWQCACLHGVPLATWTAPPTAPGPTFLDSALSPLDATSVLLKLCSRHSLPFSFSLSLSFIYLKMSFLLPSFWKIRFGIPPLGWELSPVSTLKILFHYFWVPFPFCCRETCWYKSHSFELSMFSLYCF